MRKTILLILLCFTGLGNSLNAQTTLDTSSFLITTSHNDADKFLMYIDTLDKYMYRDGKVVEQVIGICESILQKNISLPNSTLLQYATQKIYYEINNNNLLSCYQIMKDHEHLLRDKSISDKIKGSFNYISGFTIMTLGDLTSAQKIYYDLLEEGRSKKDTSRIISSTYSLGQLYADEQEYDSAIKHFSSLVELKKIYKVKPSTYSLINYELSETYIDAGQNDKALQVIKSGLAYLEKEKILRLKPDFLLLQGQIALDKKDLLTAKKIYQEITLLVKENKDPFTIKNTTIFHASLLEHQKKFPAALAIYDSLLIQLDSSQLSDKYSIFGKAHKVAFKMADHFKAYQYSTKQQAINEKIEQEKKKQETAYLKMKFESAQKERDNQQLALKVLEEQHQNRLLYFLLGAFLLGMLMLFIAFYQKKRYSQTLKEEVKKQTHELQVSNLQLNKTNKELYQFSYICSHDLKEPIQTIGTFVNLIEKKVEKENSPQDYTDYFHFINSGVTRLSNLLEQIRIYFDINNKENLASETISIKEVYQIVEKDLSELINRKNAVVVIDNQLASDYINCSKFGLLLVLKNLIQNALQFNESSPPTVNVCFTKQNGHLMLHVKDNGIGIEEQYLDYVFEPFKTLGSRDIHNSAGLGLAICKKVVLALGGEISVTSTVGSGSVFTISFVESTIVYKKQQQELVQT